MCQITACPAAFDAARKAGLSVARQFPRLCGWTVDDFDADAQAYYLRAVRSWPQTGTLSGWVYKYVRRRLLEAVRREIRRGKRVRGRRFDPKSFTVPAQDFQARLRELSEPAQATATMLFDCLRRDGRPGIRPCIIKACIARTLKVRGWNRLKINRVFGELKELVS